MIQERATEQIIEPNFPVVTITILYKVALSFEPVVGIRVTIQLLNNTFIPQLVTFENDICVFSNISKRF